MGTWEDSEVGLKILAWGICGNCYKKPMQMYPKTFDKMTHPMPINICRSYLSSNFNANKDVWGIHKPGGQLRGGGFDKRPFYNRSLFNKSEPEGGREVKNTQNFDHVVYDNP